MAAFVELGQEVLGGTLEHKSRVQAMVIKRAPHVRMEDATDR
jgi:hypothetical protein